MRLHRLAALLALAVVVVAPHAPAAAGGHRAGGHRGGGGGHFQGGHGGHGGSRGHGFYGYRSRTLILVGPSPIFGYDDPPVAYAPSPVYTPPVAYAAPAYAQPAYAPWAPPGVVQYPTGRYELRGDGIVTPYVWVWIPNPPAEPPPPPPAPPAAEPAPAPTRATPRAPASPIYRWTDEHGVTTWTDRVEKVPARYRAEAKVSLP